MIGNVIVQLTVKKQNALLSVKHHHTVSPKQHRPTVVNLKNQQPNVVNVKILHVQVEMLVTLLHLDAKLWNFNAQVTVLPILMQKRRHKKLHAHNLHHFANNVAPDGEQGAMDANMCTTMNQCISSVVYYK